MWAEFWRGIRKGLHQAGRERMATLGPTASVAFGIAGIVIAYSVARAALFTPFPYADPGSVALAWIDRGDGSRGGTSLERVE